VEPITPRYFFSRAKPEMLFSIHNVGVFVNYHGSLIGILDVPLHLNVTRKTLEANIMSTVRDMVKVKKCGHYADIFARLEHLAMTYELFKQPIVKEVS
jgi:hypothetical protein